MTRLVVRLPRRSSAQLSLDHENHGQLAGHWCLGAQSPVPGPTLNSSLTSTEVVAMYSLRKYRHLRRAYHRDEPPRAISDHFAAVEAAAQSASRTQ